MIIVDNINLEAATHQRGVCEHPDSNSFQQGTNHRPDAGLGQDLPQAHIVVKDGGWGRSRFMGSELYGKTVGIVGLGRIGFLVATASKPSICG